MILEQLKSYYFWFSQPSTLLSVEDKYFLYLFLSLILLGVVLWLSRKLSANPVNKKLLNKFSAVAFYTGLSGLFWFGLRFENPPIFARRYWAALTIIVALIWLGFVLKYLIINYSTEKIQAQREFVKNKYIPGGNR